MRKFSFFLIPVVLLLSLVSTNIDDVSASCAMPAYGGQWINESQSPELVLKATITPVCSDFFAEPVGGYSKTERPPDDYPMVHIIGLCETGACNWGLSPGSAQDNNKFFDGRSWLNASTQQMFEVLPNGKLKVTTMVYFNDGSNRTFTDVMRRGEYQVQATIPTPLVSAHFKVIEATPDGCLSASGCSNQFRPRIWFTAGTNQFQKDWDLNSSVPLNVGTVDIIFQLKEADNWPNPDDHFDINPEVGEKDLHIRVSLETGAIYQVQEIDGSYVAVNLIGGKGSHIRTDMEANWAVPGQDRARVEYYVDVAYPTSNLMLPTPRANLTPDPVLPTLTSPPMPLPRREPPEQDASQIMLPNSSPGCQRPNIVEFYAGAAPEGSTASFRLYYKVEGADRVEIFGNVLEQHDGTFDVWTESEDTAHWVIWAKADGTPDDCYAEKGLYVTPGNIILSD